MKAVKTFLVIAILAVVILGALTFIMPKVAFNQKKALVDSYKIAKTQTDTDSCYKVRIDLGKGTWEDFEMTLERKGWKASDPAEFWPKSPNKELFTAAEIRGFEKEYCRKSSKMLPIQEKYFTEYIAVMKDEAGYHLYFEVQMTDSEITPCH